MKNLRAISGILLTLCMFTSSLVSQDTLFMKVYDTGSTYDYGYSIQQTPDRGYIICGFQEFLDSRDTSLVIKLSPSGDVEWSTGVYFDNMQNYSDFVHLYSIKQTPDSGYIAVGQFRNSSSNSLTDALILKLSSDGSSVEWVKIYRTSGHEAFKIVQVTQDSGYIAAGWSGGISMIVKLLSDGTIEWMKTYKLHSANFIEQTSDGGYIVSGDILRGGGYGRDIVLLKLSSDGTVEWAKSYGISSTSQEIGYSVKQTTDGGYIIAGYTSAGINYSVDILIIKVDMNGVVEWAKAYGTPDDDRGYSVEEMSHGGYVVAGYVGGISRISTLLNLSSDGTVEWVKTYDVYGGITQVHETFDRNIVGVGGMYSVDIFVLKTDPYGNIGNCPFVQDTSVITVSPSVIESSLSYIDTSVAAVIDSLEFLTTSLLLTEDTLCETSIGVDEYSFFTPVEDNESILEDVPLFLKDEIILRFNRKRVLGKDLKIMLYDKKGSTILKKSFYSIPFILNIKDAKINNLPSGTYFLDISIDEKKAEKFKIIKP